jgi:hypothetical protein
MAMGAPYAPWVTGGAPAAGASFKVAPDAAGGLDRIPRDVPCVNMAAAAGVGQGCCVGWLLAAPVRRGLLVGG